MTIDTLKQETVVPEEGERQLYRQLEQLLAAPTARLIGEDGQVTAIPQKMSRILRTFAHLLAANKVVIVTATNKDLTTQQAADVLGISRPSLVRLLEEKHAIPFRRTGKQRRVSFADLLTYREREYRRQRHAMADLTRVGEEMGGYELSEGHVEASDRG